MNSKSNFLPYLNSYKNFKPGLNKTSIDTAVNINTTLQQKGEINNTETNIITENNLTKRSSMQASNVQSNIKVVARFRPLNDVENDLMKNSVGFICYEAASQETVKIKSDTLSNNVFTFDRIFPTDCKQEELFNYIGKETVNDVLSGYNGTIFTYGQSGSGKTYTLYGSDIYDEVQRGLIPRLV
jgi:kinesin family protein 5